MKLRTANPLLLVLATLATTACASTPDTAAQTASTPELQGCYFFEAGEAVETLRLPRGVRLTDEALEGYPAIMSRGDVKVAVTLRADDVADYPFGYWLWEGDDAVEIGYPAGGGLVLDLAIDGDALDGTARAVGDARLMDADAEGLRPLPVRLEPGDCPAGS